MMILAKTATRSTILIAILLIGCGENSVPSTAETPKTRSGGVETKANAEESTGDASAAKPKKNKFQPVQLRGDAGAAGQAGESAAAKPSLSGEKRSQAVIGALQPLQVLLGGWRWITRKDFGGSKKSGEDLRWIWDFQTDEAQPSLTAKSEAHPYFQQVWLTYLPDDEKYQTTARTPDGQTRVFRGTWTDTGAPKEESDGKKVQHTFKMQMNQVSPDDGDQWQLVFNLLDNDQYLMELTRRPATGKQFGPLDVVRQQRLGTSFAVADSDNPGPKCIISGGLGTMSVTYKGKSYPVCCSGCAAAFNDDPEKWLAKLAAREKAKKSGDE